MSYCPEDGDRMEPLNDDFTLYLCPCCLMEWRYDDPDSLYAVGKHLLESEQHG